MDDLTARTRGPVTNIDVQPSEQEPSLSWASNTPRPRVRRGSVVQSVGKGRSRVVSVEVRGRWTPRVGTAD
jgi:hypothetical protein